MSQMHQAAFVSDMRASHFKLMSNFEALNMKYVSCLETLGSCRLLFPQLHTWLPPYFYVCNIKVYRYLILHTDIPRILVVKITAFIQYTGMPKQKTRNKNSVRMCTVTPQVLTCRETDQHI